MQLGEIELGQGHLAKAVTLLRGSLATQERLGAATFDRAEGNFLLARSLAGTGSRAEAMALARQALTAYEQSGREFAPLADAVRRWLVGTTAVKRAGEVRERE
jgi:hypothetical protein